MFRVQSLLFPETHQASLATYLFDDASDARDSAYAGALKLGHLQLAVEHATQEGGVLVHLEGGPLQLQLLHNAHRGVQV